MRHLLGRQHRIALDDRFDLRAERGVARLHAAQRPLEHCPVRRQVVTRRTGEQALHAARPVIASNCCLRLCQLLRAVSSCSLQRRDLLHQLRDRAHIDDRQLRVRSRDAASIDASTTNDRNCLTSSLHDRLPSLCRCKKSGSHCCGSAPVSRR